MDERAAVPLIGIVIGVADRRLFNNRAACVIVRGPDQMALLIVCH